MPSPEGLKAPDGKLTTRHILGLPIYVHSMRAIWSGTIVFGMVALPVQMFAAAEEEGAGLLEVHAADGGRIRHRRVCELEGREVAHHQIARGWQAPDGRMVVLHDADMAVLPLPAKRVIEILGFIGSDQLDPILYSRPYWLAAHGPGARRPYALMVEALSRTGRVAVGKVAIRTRERLAVLRPRHGMLLCQTLLWPAEVRDPGDLSSPTPVTDRELAMAETLMEQLAGVDLEALHDEYAAALDQLIDAKIAGRTLQPPGEPEPATDLMAALEESVRAARHAREESATPPQSDTGEGL